MIIAAPNDLAAEMHAGMPMVLERSNFDAWLKGWRDRISGGGGTPNSLPDYGPPPDEY
jgi:hypothetical protein